MYIYVCVCVCFASSVVFYMSRLVFCIECYVLRVSSCVLHLVLCLTCLVLCFASCVVFALIGHRKVDFNYFTNLPLVSEDGNRNCT